jgi:Fibronectin type III domain
MSKNLLFLLFASLWLHATTGNAAAFYPSKADVLMEDNCNLPGPSNLTNTGATTTSLAFSWDPVAGSNGYEILLSEVVTGDPIYSDHIFTESVNITGLNPDTEYELKVWSVCSNGGLGGYSAIIARTDYVIVEDIITTRQFNNEVPGNNFPLYIESLNSEPIELFKIKSPNKYKPGIQRPIYPPC